MKKKGRLKNITGCREWKMVKWLFFVLIYFHCVYFFNALSLSLRECHKKVGNKIWEWIKSKRKFILFLVLTIKRKNGKNMAWDGNESWEFEMELRRKFNCNCIFVWDELFFGLAEAMASGREKNVLLSSLFLQELKISIKTSALKYINFFILQAILFYVWGHDATMVWGKDSYEKEIFIIKRNTEKFHHSLFCFSSFLVVWEIVGNKTRLCGKRRKVWCILLQKK